MMPICILFLFRTVSEQNSDYTTYKSVGFVVGWILVVVEETAACVWQGFGSRERLLS